MIQDIETERSILSGVLQHGKDGWVEISDLLKCESFAGDNNQVYFKCIENAITKSDKIDKPLFYSSSHVLGLDSIIAANKAEVDELFNQSVALKNIRVNAKKIAKLSIGRISRNKLRSAMSVIEKISGDEKMSEILSMVEKPGYEVQALLNCDEDGGLIGKDAVSYVESLINAPNREVGIHTGLDLYDKAIGDGIRRGGFALIGARRKIGKSSLAVNIALHVANKIKIPVLYLDSEMQSYEHVSRILANMTGIPISTIEHATFTGNQMFKTQLRDAAKKLLGLAITHERVAGKDFDEVISIMRRWLIKDVGYHSSGKINNCLIIYDYFKLADSSSLKSMKEYEAIGFQSIKLHDFLGEMDVPCLAFVQLNRESEIAQSDRLSWNATSVCLYAEKTPEEIINDGVENGNRKIIFDVARFGEGLAKDDYINVDFNGSLCQIKEVCTAYEAKSERAIGKSGFKVNDDAPF